jgi:organic radical activating enzyme
LNYGNIKYNCIEDGEGVRIAVFVSGCRNHCKGCFQPQTWDFDFGNPFTEEVQSKVFKELKKRQTGRFATEDMLMRLRWESGMTFKSI